MSSKESHIGLSNYDIHFFGNIYEKSPQSIILMDSNSIILQRCKSGLFRDELESIDIEFTENQLQFLIESQLLKIENNRLITNFPIIERELSNQLRKHSRHIVEKSLVVLKPQLLQLKSALLKLGFKNNFYSILFSYILDFLVWHNLNHVQGTMKNIPTTKAPFWAGYLWAIYPSRSFFCGTNKFSHDDIIKLFLTWSEMNKSIILKIQSDYIVLKHLREDFLKYGHVKDTQRIEYFHKFGIVDKKGNITIPVIIEKSTNNLYSLCSQLARMIAEQVNSQVNIGELKVLLGIKNLREIMIIFYHEFMWDLLKSLEIHQIIKKPVLFQDFKSKSLKNLCELVFLVKK